MHITLRTVRPLPSLRAQLILARMRSVLRHQRGKAYAARFQIAHFSVQDTHVHLVVEAHEDAVRSGLSGFLIAFARQLNSLLGRKGRVWSDRYHRRDIATPTETRNLLRYVFQNFRKHMLVRGGQGVVDPYTSARTFDGWSAPITIWTLPDDTEPWIPVPARTWLLAKGWKRAGGLLDPSEAPRSQVRTAPPPRSQVRTARAGR